MQIILIFYFALTQYCLFTPCIVFRNSLTCSYFVKYIFINTFVVIIFSNQMEME